MQTLLQDLQRADTMTLITAQNQRIDVGKLFFHLPVARKSTQRFSTGDKFPEETCKDGEMGEIVSMSHNGISRGQGRSALGGYMLHSVSVKMQLGPSKTVQIKASPSNLHMCGVTSMEHAKTTATLFNQAVSALNMEFEYIETLPRETCLATLRFTQRFCGPPVTKLQKQRVSVTYSSSDWVRENTDDRNLRNSAFSDLHIVNPPTGQLEVTIHEFITNRTITKKVPIERIRWLMKRPDVSRRTKEKFSTTLMYEAPLPTRQETRHMLLPLPLMHNLNVPPNVDARLLKLMFNNHQDFDTFDGWFSLNNQLLTTSLRIRELKIDRILSSMVNYHVTLNFAINCEKLAKMFERNKFAVYFDNNDKDYVLIMVPFQKSPDILRKKPHEVDAVEFTITSRGKMTITGPSEQANREAYTKVIETILRFQSDVEDRSGEIMHTIPAKKQRT